MSQQTKSRWSWHSKKNRSWLYQLLAVILIGLIVWFLARHAAHNMQQRGMQSGFDFLWQAAGFDIGESLFTFDPEQSYWRAFLVGLLNTLRVSMLGVVLATMLGVVMGLGRLSHHPLARLLSSSYVEFFRNVPLLLQLLMWYLLFTDVLPSADRPWRLDTWFGPLFLSKGGLAFPAPYWSADGLSLSPPTLGDFAIEGGAALTPEFLALLCGLSLYSAAFIAEVVRAGLQSVPRGQAEACAALGLDRRQTLRLVLLPQALRVIIPPLTNQYLNLTKNSSLAVAIGYPDVVSIANTSINQTGRAMECIAIVMLIYLTTSVLTSWFMGWYNARAAIVER